MLLWFCMKHVPPAKCYTRKHVLQFCPLHKEACSAVLPITQGSMFCSSAHYTRKHVLQFCPLHKEACSAVLPITQGSMFCSSAHYTRKHVLQFCPLHKEACSAVLPITQGSMFCSSAHYTRKHVLQFCPLHKEACSAVLPITQGSMFTDTASAPRSQTCGRKSYGAPDSGFAATDSGIPRVLMAVKRWQRTRQTLCSCWLEEGEVKDCNKIIK